MKVLLWVLAALLTPPFLLSVIIIGNSYDSLDWGSIPDWIGILLTISFGIYAIKWWLKPKIDSDVYEYAKKIVIFDFADAEKKVSEEVTLTYIQSLLFKVSHGIHDCIVETKVNDFKLYTIERIQEKHEEAIVMQSLIHNMDRDLKVMRKLGKELRPEIKKLQRDLSDRCLLLFLNVSVFWLDLSKYSLSIKDSKMPTNDLNDLDLAVDNLQVLRNEYLEVSSKIYNYSTDIMDYFVDTPKKKNK